MERKIERFAEKKISKEKMAEIFQGWNAYAKGADSFGLRLKVLREIATAL